MLKRVLIANRGEIACRIMRTAERLGIETVAVYSDADAHARHVAMADQAVRIGPGPATESYLSIDAILDAAKATGADAIHPGYGFLSENAGFAARVAEAGLTFVGPTAAQMEALGSKAAAKEIAERAGVPTIPGYRGADQSADALKAAADGMGYPVMIKAVSGGGGRGMRLVTAPEDFADALESAQREAASAFADATVLIERAITRPRHVEVQVFGDTHGNALHLFERDCSLQRRNQKVIEEAPAPGFAAAVRNAMCDAAVRLTREVGYAGAGTVEFLVEPNAGDDGWYFIEMNTRLQVEHPVTEMITGLDLVEWQFRVASGEALACAQDDIGISGHAIEVRLCAEDPAKGFQPSVGTIHVFDTPAGEGLRVETGVGSGDVVSPFYDSMIAKLITHAPTREAARLALADALSATTVVGFPTNARFLRALLLHDDVAAADRASGETPTMLDTGLIARDLGELSQAPVSHRAIAVGLERLFESAETLAGRELPAVHAVWQARDGFALGVARRETRSVLINSAPQSVEIAWAADGLSILSSDLDTAGATSDAASPVTAVASDDRVFVVDDLVHTSFALPVAGNAEDDDDAGDGVIRAPINGRVARVFVADGDTVADG
ncbi:MAG: biotin carboxylase N-terminal domain-containing protein, partial [Pseudomonadota bacterium]